MYLIINVWLLITVQQLLAANSCTTPNDEPGECVKITDCPNLAKLFSNPNPEIVPFLKKYKCKPRDSTYWVCCKNTTTATMIPLSKLSDKRYCGYQHSDDYFSENQQSTAIDEFPWLAAIVGTDDNNETEIIPCQGSLINSRYVLSAAHCFLKQGKHIFTPKKVLLGEYYLKNNTDCVYLPQFGARDCNKPEEYGIEEIIVHPLLDKLTGFNDISLIRLDREVTFTDFIRPICLPVFCSIGAKVGDTLYTTGWGKKTLKTEPSDIKKKIKSTWISNEECDLDLSKFQVGLKTTDYRICTKDDFNGTEFSCQGDSGASLMYNHNNQWFLEGIVSKGTPCGPNAVNIHTRIFKYLDWIRENIIMKKLL